MRRRKSWKALLLLLGARFRVYSLGFVIFQASNILNVWVDQRECANMGLKSLTRFLLISEIIIDGVRLLQTWARFGNFGAEFWLFKLMWGDSRNWSFYLFYTFSAERTSRRDFGNFKYLRRVLVIWPYLSGILVITGKTIIPELTLAILLKRLINASSSFFCKSEIHFRLQLSSAVLHCLNLFILSLCIYIIQTLCFRNRIATCHSLELSLSSWLRKRASA